MDQNQETLAMGTVSVKPVVQDRGSGKQTDNTPLVVDLDGTLVRTDTLHELLFRLLFTNPFLIFWVSLSLLKGRAHLKARVASKLKTDARLLPYNTGLCAWLRERANAGQTLVLCTAADSSVASDVAEHLGFFSEIISSDGETNLAGAAKAAELVRRYGYQKFDYAGNSTVDLHVWKQCRDAVVVSSNRAVLRETRKMQNVKKVFPKKPTALADWLRQFRVHQWLKNILIFVPAIAAHQITQVENWMILLAVFLSFSACASSVYIINDIADLESDRRHLTKRSRPIAAGDIGVFQAAVAASALLPISLLTAYLVNLYVFLSILTYVFINILYTYILKKIAIIDCITLSLLYTVRILAGIFALNLDVSYWLIAFSTFLFTSLAFIKRYAELKRHSEVNKEQVPGRGYMTSDAPVVQNIGVSSGFASVVVLALYVNSEAFSRLYINHEIVWGLIPCMVFWNSWMWLQAHRGSMHDDPVVFAIKDRTSLFAGFIFAAIVLLGTTKFSM